MMEDSRHYQNQFSDYSTSQSTNLISSTNTIHDGFKKKLRENIEKLLQRLEDNKHSWKGTDDYSVYTGLSGIAYLFYQYGKRCNQFDYIEKAMDILSSCIKKFKNKKKISFLTGYSGPLALAAIIDDSLKGGKSQDFIQQLKALCPYVTSESDDLPNELLYGRVGYLFSLLFVNNHISPAPFKDDIIIQVISTIIKVGKEYSQSTNCQSPIMYSWHDKEYIGGAHGLGGILYILLQARQYLTETQLQKYIKPALLYLQSLKFSSGNFPSSNGNHSDRLVQWCHGSPGLTMLFCLAYETFKEEEFLQTALQCGEVTWIRGLLSKGDGICHGVAGNAYSFLILYQQTQDMKHLYRACKFAEFCMNEDKHRNRSPDRPFSLFEGLAGVIYFLCDLKCSDSAKFPGYTLSTKQSN